MSQEEQIHSLVEQALDILTAFGIPTSGLTSRRRERMAKAFLAIAGMKPGKPWQEALSIQDGHKLGSREIIRYVNKYFGESIGEGSYDDIRRKDLLFPVEAGIALASAGRDSSNRNDGTRAYAVSSEYIGQIRTFGAAGWEAGLADFLRGRTVLAQELLRTRNLQRIPIRIGDAELSFGPGEHNRLQKAVIDIFLPLFGHGAQVAYVGDAEDRSAFLDKELLHKVSFFELKADKLPDIVAYSESKNWLFLVEAVHSANPINEIRRRSLQILAADCTAGMVFVTAFLTRKSFSKFAKDIAWETEVWIAEAPEHLIHFNGDKFFGPHK